MRAFVLHLNLKSFMSYLTLKIKTNKEKNKNLYIAWHYLQLSWLTTGSPPHRAFHHMEERLRRKRVREHNWIQLVFAMMYTHTHMHTQQQSTDCLKRGNIAHCFTSTPSHFIGVFQVPPMRYENRHSTYSINPLHWGFWAYLHSLPMWLDPNRGCS